MRILKSSAYILILIFFSLTHFPDYGHAEEYIKKKGIIILLSDNENKIGTGSIIKIKGNTVYILTAYHVVAGEDRITVKFYREKDFPFEAEATIYEKWMDKNNDVAVIYIEDLDLRKISPEVIFLGESIEVKERDGVTSIGHLSSHENWLYAGGEVIDVNATTIRYDSNTVKEGFSGGAVFDNNGFMIGMNTFITEEGGEAFALRPSILRPIIESWIGLASEEPKRLKIDERPRAEAEITRPEVSFTTRPPQATEVLKSQKGFFELWFDPTKWTKSSVAIHPEAEFTLIQSMGEAYAMAIVERISMPLSTLKEIALQNAQRVAPDTEVIFEEKRVVNETEMLVMRMEGTMEGISFTYYGYYWTGKAGSLQVLTMTGQNLFNEFEADLTDLLNGLVITKPSAETEITRPEVITLKTRSPQATEVLKSQKGFFELWFDPTKWTKPSVTINPEAEFTLIHTSGDAYAMAIVERISMPLSTLKEIAHENAQSAAPDTEIIFEEKRDVNGAEMLVMRMESTIEGISFAYYGYYWTGKAGSLQVLTMTGQNLFNEFEADLTDLLNGIVITKPSAETEITRPEVITLKTRSPQSTEVLKVKKAF